MATIKVQEGQAVAGREKAQKQADRTGKPVSLLHKIYIPVTRGKKAYRSAWTTYDTVYPSMTNPSLSSTGQWIKAKAVRIRKVGGRLVADILTTGKRALGNPAKSNYEVIVGNIGSVYYGSNYKSALRAYGTYVRSSQMGGGRAGNEDVTLMKDGEPVKEHFGGQENPRRGRSAGTRRNPARFSYADWEAVIPVADWFRSGQIAGNSPRWNSMAEAWFSRKQGSLAGAPANYLKAAKKRFTAGFKYGRAERYNKTGRR